MNSVFDSRTRGPFDEQFDRAAAVRDERLLPLPVMVALYQGRAIACRRLGPRGGPTLLLLHGIGSNSRSFAPQLRALADRFDVIAWDAPGYGASEDPARDYTLDDFASAAACVLDRLGCERTHILGHSFGGVIAQRLYQLAPSRVCSLILSDTNAGSGTLREPERSARLQRRLDDLATLTPRELARKRAPGLLSPNAPTALVDEVVDVMAAIRPPGYRSAAVAMSRADLSADLERIAVPTLVIHGGVDTVISPTVGRDLARRIPGARWTVIDGAGHASNLEAPEDYTSAVRDFLNGAPC